MNDTQHTSLTATITPKRRRLMGGGAMTAPTPTTFTDDDREWMRTMGFKPEQIEAEKARREKLATRS